MKIIIRIILCIFLIAAVGSCGRKGGERGGIRTVEIEATGYCKCGSCCGWKRNLLMQPVYAYGPSKGKKKEVGITASGTKAKVGTIAADINIYPYGTRMNVPGYGWGVVEDIGGAIKGARIDLFFNSHQDALEWGRKTVKVEVVLPDGGSAGGARGDRRGSRKKDRSFLSPFSTDGDTESAFDEETFEGFSADHYEDSGEFTTDLSIPTGD